MEKNDMIFNERNKEKKKIEFQWKHKIVKSWEIWLCKIWINIGSESSKDGNFMRPVIILKTWIGWDLVNIIPLTTKYKPLFYQQYYPFNDYYKYWLDRPTYFLLNQCKTISIKRLVRALNNIWTIPLVPFIFIKKLSSKAQSLLFP